MSRSQCRGSIALTAVLITLLASRAADAQGFVEQPPPRRPVTWYDRWILGTCWDTAAEAHAEQHLVQAQARYDQDAARGDTTAMERDAGRIDHSRYRIAVADWLLRKNTCQCFGYYPIVNGEMPCPLPPHAPCAPPPQAPDVAAPTPTPEPVPATPVPATPVPATPVPASPTLTITIVNADQMGPAVDFAINGVAHQAAGGSRQDLAVAPDANITYDGGGSLGQRRYLLSPGVYEFRSTAEGRAFYKVPDKP